MERMTPDEDWIIHETADFGERWHQLVDILYLSGEDNDLVILGGYHPSLEYARTFGFIMRYYRAEQRWETFEVIAPESWSTWWAGAVLDPHDPDRLILYGTKSTSPTACPGPRPILAEFDLSTNTHSFMNMGDIRGTIYSVAVLEDKLLATGIGGNECDYTGVLHVLNIQNGIVTIAPSPPPLPDHPLSSLTGLTVLPDGRVLGVGTASQTLGSHWRTLSYLFDPERDEWELIKPIDPGQTLPTGDNNYINQLFTITQAPDGTAYAGGRWTHYNGRYHHKGMVQRFDGEEWCLQELPEFLGENTSINSQVLGLAATDTDVYAAGWWNQGSLPYYEQTLVLHAPIHEPVPGILQVDPPEFNFGEVELGQSGVAEFIVSNAAEKDAEPLLLDHLSLSGLGFGMNASDCADVAELPPQQACTVEVDFHPPEVGTYSGALTIGADDGQGGQTATVTLSGIGVQLPGELEVTPLKLDFGRVEPGETALLAVILNNVAGEGAAALQLTGIEIIVGQEGFSIDADGSGCGAELAAQQRCTVAVRFSPVGGNSYSGVLRIAAGGEPAVNVILTGAGAADVPVEGGIFRDRFEND